MKIRHIVAMIAGVITIIAFVTGSDSIQEFLHISPSIPSQHEPEIQRDGPEMEVGQKYNIFPGHYTINKSIENKTGLLTVDSVEVDKDGNFTIFVTVRNTSGRAQFYGEVDPANLRWWLWKFFLWPESIYYCTLKNTFGENKKIISFGGVFDGASLESETHLKGWVKFRPPPKWQYTSTYVFHYVRQFPPLLFRMPPQ